MLAVVVGQDGEIPRPAGRIADGVEQDLHLGQPRIAIEPDPELDDLGIDGRSRIADGLDVELPELAIAARLRPVVPEHRPDLAQLDRLRPGLHPVLDVGANDAGGGFRAEGERLGLLGPRREPEQLLLDDVGDLADPALEDGGRLEQRRLDPPVAVAGAQPLGELLESRPDGRVGGQQVTRAAWRSQGWHRAECYTADVPERSAEVALDGEDVLELLDAAHDPRQLRHGRDLERGGHDGRVVRGDRDRRRR